MVTKGALPPHPFAAQEDPLDPGAAFYRLHRSALHSCEFNPGFGRPTRFAFFGNPPVPVLYAAETQEAALCESLLHNVPARGGVLEYELYRDAVMSRIRVTRRLRLAKLRGTGLRALGIEASDVTDTGARDYPRTVKWAQAAFEAGFDGLSWTSRKCNDAKAVVLFGDGCANSIEQDPGFARLFLHKPDLAWLTRTCQQMCVSVEQPRVP